MGSHQHWLATGLSRGAGRAGTGLASAGDRRLVPTGRANQSELGLRGESAWS